MIKDFFVKNMVCDRCIKVLRDELEKEDIECIGNRTGPVALKC